MNIGHTGGNYMSLDLIRQQDKINNFSNPEGDAHIRLLVLFMRANLSQVLLVIHINNGILRGGL